MNKHLCTVLAVFKTWTFLSLFNQVRAMIQILKRFGWTWVGLLVSDDDYGLHVARSFQSDLVQYGAGCLAYSEILPWGYNPVELKRIVKVMKKSAARVVIVFAHQIHMIQIMEEVFMYLCTLTKI